MNPNFAQLFNPNRKRNIDISVATNPTALGTVLEVKKGRATISFTQDELEYIAQFGAIIALYTPAAAQESEIADEGSTQTTGAAQA